MKPNTESYLPVAEVAAAVGVPKRTLYRWIQAKKLASRRDGRSTLVALEVARGLATNRKSLTRIGHT